MQTHELTSLGEEPIYCQTQDDDILYSGSEDDYYEKPEHRRMRIEAKAVQYLNGNAPYILTARLRGPFNAKVWNNPWKSKRAQRRAAAQRDSQSRPNLVAADMSRSPASTKATCNDNLPDTQKTSLFPLPSPGITNPPSARHNPFLAEDQLSRIKTWRETVKKVPTSKDPFWISYRNATQSSPVSKKRSGDQDWLHKRPSKKRKPENTRTLANDESPSQAAAKTRGSQMPDRFTDLAARSAPGSSAHDDELGAQLGHRPAGINTSQMMNMPINTSGALRTARKSPLKTQQVCALTSDSSDDEYSLPSIAPSSPVKLPIASTSGGRSSSQKKAEVAGPVTRARSSQAHETRVAMDNTSRDSTSRSARRRHSKGFVRSDLVDNANGSAQSAARKLVHKPAKMAVGASQRDDSFYFHQAQPKYRSSPSHLIQTGQMKETKLSLPPFQRATVIALQISNQESNGGSQEEGNGNSISTSPPDQMDVDPNDAQDASVEATRQIANVEFDGKLADVVGVMQVLGEPQVAVSLKEVGNGPQEDDGNAKCSHHGRPTICTDVESDLPKQACTQELSPVSMQSKPQTTAPAPHHDFSASRISLDTHDADVSNPEWSTYVNTQDLLPGSQQPSAATEVAVKESEDAVDPEDPEWTTYVNTQDTAATEDAVKESEDAVDPEDPEWTTYVNTQETAAAVTERDMIPENKDRVQVVVQGLDVSSDPDWSTFVNTQDLSMTESQLHEPPITNTETAVDYEGEIDTDATESVMSYMSVSSEADAEHTGNTSSEPVAVDAHAVDSKESQDTLGCIIDGYAVSDQSIDEYGDCPESQEPIVQHRESTGAMQHPEVEEVAQLEVQEERHSTAQTEASQSDPDPTALRIPSGSPMETEETPADRASNASLVQSEPHMAPTEASATDCDETTASLESQDLTTKTPSVQSPWAKCVTDLPMPVALNTETPATEQPSLLSVLAGKSLAFSPAPQTPWLGDGLPSPNFSLSVKKFSDFMKPSPEKKKRLSANGSILRSPNRDSTSRVLFRTPVPVKPKRHVQFAPLPGENKTLLALAESKDKEDIVEEDLSYFDAKGVKTASIRITHSHTRAASPPPADINIANAEDLPDHDDKFARHFEAISQRTRHPPRKTQRLLPSESQQTDGSQAVDAMAEAFIEASQTRQKSVELMGGTNYNGRQSETSPEKTVSPMGMHSVHEVPVCVDEPVDDVSAVLDNIGDFLDNSWGYNTSMEIEKEAPAKQETPVKQRTSIVPSRFANAGDPMLAMHANVWAD